LAAIGLADAFGAALAAGFTLLACLLTGVLLTADVFAAGLVLLGILPLTVVDFAELAEPTEVDLAAGLEPARAAGRLDCVFVALLLLALTAAFDLVLFFAELFFVERVLADTVSAWKRHAPVRRLYPVGPGLRPTVRRCEQGNRESEIRRLDSPNLAHFPQKSMVYAQFRPQTRWFGGLKG
jgi:hypothetical protein